MDFLHEFQHCLLGEPHWYSDYAKILMRCLKDENKIITDKPDYVIILAWHLTKRIISLLLKKGYKGNFITPLPKLKILKN